MKTFKKQLMEELKNDNFSKLFNEERELLSLSIKILEKRTKLGISQKELAKKAHITQQQLSKVENGINCNIITFLKVCGALDLNINFKNKRIRI
jgi:HTH-type transcriptional regulator / antitoxin HipB